MRPLAIMPVYNEADILPAVLRHLEHQGCDVYILDNWSTDWSPELLSIAGNDIERWPADRPTMYDWTAILKRIEEIAVERAKGRWVILHDADEIRRVPNDWATLTLAQALEIATITGYNAAQFKVRTYVPVDHLWSAGDNPERRFRYHKPEHVDHGLPHIKAWFQGDERVDIHTHGGHQALFSNRHVCPHSFVLKHYPIRSQEHGERKVLKERFPRYPPNERSKRWHVQYDEYVQTPTPEFVCSPEGLCRDKNTTTIVTLAHSAETFHSFADSVELHEPSCRRIAVTTGDVTIDRPGWELVKGTAANEVSRNLNLGIAAAGADDVLYASCEVEFTNPVVEELSEVSFLASGAIVSAQVIDRYDIAIPGYRVEARWKHSKVSNPFACVLLPRSVLDALGPFDGNCRFDMELGIRAFQHEVPLVASRCRVRQREQKPAPVLEHATIKG
jgi:hypothetical protein